MKSLPKIGRNSSPEKGTILKGSYFIFQSHEFSGDMLVFRGVNI